MIDLSLIVTAEEANNHTLSRDGLLDFGLRF